MSEPTWQNNAEPILHHPEHAPQYAVIKTTIKTGISFGACLAMVVSYVSWGSIPWAIFHGLLGWIYVGYYAITKLL